jgi:hypothetical protein
VHDLQGVGLLVDQNEEELVRKTGQRPFRATASTALACFALLGELRGIRGFVRTLKRRPQVLKLCQR